MDTCCLPSPDHNNMPCERRRRHPGQHLVTAPDGKQRVWEHKSGCTSRNEFGWRCRLPGYHDGKHAFSA